MSFTRSLYQLGFEISPVILCDGIASSITGGMLPIVALTQTASFIGSLVSGDVEVGNLDKYFCHWQVAPGGTLVDYDIATYPFANQTVAANALLAKPLGVSMIMQAPINEKNGVLSKFTTLSALQAVLQAHASLGGTYTVATPAVIHTACVLKQLRDVSAGGSSFGQNTWQWDFEKPLVTESDAAAAVNNLIGKIDSGDKVTSSSWTSAAAALGNTSLGGSVTSVADQIIGLIGQLSSSA